MFDALNPIRKRGLHAMITVVLVMVVSASLAALVAFALTSSVTASLSPALPCTSFQLNPPIVINKAEINSNTEAFEVTVTRALDASLLGEMQLTLQSSTGAQRVTCSSTCSSCSLPEPGETKTYRIDEEPAEKVQSVVLSVDTCPLQTLIISP